MNRKSFDIDLITLLLYLALMAWGWMTIYANTSVGGHPSPLDMGAAHGKQLLWIGITLVVAMVMLTLDLRFVEKISYLAYGAGIVLLILTLFIGREINGARSWIFIGGQPFQPSEFAKLATALALARYWSRTQGPLGMSRLLVAAGMVLLPALIVILQNDTGSALVFGCFLLVFFREGLSPIVPILLILVGATALGTLGLENQPLVIGILIGLAVFSYFLTFQRKYAVRLLVFHLLGLAFFIGLSFSTQYIVSKLPDHQQTRIMVLFNPSIDPQGSGYNVIQSKIAIGSGGISGKGYLEGNYTKYKFVPKQDTDFIYCTIGEEFGWIGSSLVLLLFFFLIWRLLFLSENSKTRFARVYGYSVLSIIFFHVLVNVGMTIGLVPVIGIPLPFFSYGGSSLLSFTVLITLMINLYSSRIRVLGTKA